MNAPADPSPEPLVTLINFNFGIGDIFLFIAIVLLLGASALFAGAEVAFFSISGSERDQIKKGESRGHRLAEKLLQKPKDLLATILIGKNILNVTFVVLTGLFLTKIFNVWFSSFWLILILNIIIITLFLLFVGETYPKTLAFRNKARFTRFMSPYIYFFHVLPPFSWLKIPIAKSSNILEKRAKSKGIKISKDTLETVLTLSQNESESSDSVTMLRGVMKFADTEVKQIMCPRMDVVGVDINTNLDDVIKVVVDAGYSRIPVFRETFDDVLGIVFVKDLLPHLSKGAAFNWQELIRDPFFVPENKKIDDLLKEFQQKKLHMAIVVDEYGGSNGVVTLEDVLEEIVGDITDEYDEDEQTFTQLNDHTYLFEASTSLSDFYKAINIDGRAFENLKEDAESLGGLIVQTAGRIPKMNESITVENIQLIVEVSDKKRVKKVRVVIN